MDEANMSRDEMVQDLAQCENRIKELRGQVKDDELANELDELQEQVASCRVDLDALKDKVEEEWGETKNRVVKKFRDVRNNLSLTSRKIMDEVR